MIHPNDPSTQRSRGDGSAPDVDDMKNRARETAERVKQSGEARLDSGKEAAADRAERLADAVHRVGAESEREGDQTIAAYAGDLASGLERFADSLRNRSINDLVSEAQTLARRNPVLFVAGSIGVGFALARFLKASSDSHRTQGQDRELQGRDQGRAQGMAPQQFGDDRAEYHDAPAGGMRGVHTERTDLGSSPEREYVAGNSSAGNSSGAARASTQEPRSHDRPQVRTAPGQASARQASSQSPTSQDSSMSPSTDSTFRSSTFDK